MKILEKLGNLFAAVAFAEEGDAETARRLAAGDEEVAPAARVRSARPAPRPAPRPGAAATTGGRASSAGRS